MQSVQRTQMDSAAREREMKREAKELARMQQALGLQTQSSGKKPTENTGSTSKQESDSGMETGKPVKLSFGKVRFPGMSIGEEGLGGLNNLVHQNLMYSRSLSPPHLRGFLLHSLEEKGLGTGHWEKIKPFKNRHPSGEKGER